MASNANSKRLRSLRPMATRLVSSPSPLVAFSFVAWDDIPVVVPTFLVVFLQS